ncbi:hypothetical protein [Pseudobacteriovorax antillogorgiicola]|uniref:hypothetical protein n=1 Tax=Pseudobacteriovorax antillogorgiicola TaxID=1513793 RepID=UPI001356466B|nr:hypothetical protein [Pseudobacteriovorax antillogorgiicola]
MDRFHSHSFVILYSSLDSRHIRGKLKVISELKVGLPANRVGTIVSNHGSWYHGKSL